MIEAGKVFCPYCAHVSEEAYYRTPVRKEGVYLHRRRNGSYAVSIATDIMERNGVDTSSMPKVEFYGPSGQDDGNVPRMIQVIFDGSGTPERMNRHCPHCGNQVKLGLGNYPTFVTGLVGAAGCGKSVLLNAMSYPQNVLSVNSIHYPYKLKILPFAPRRSEAQATEISGRGMTKVVSIQDQNDQTIAHMVLLDVSGEFYWRETKKEIPNPEQIWDLLCGNGEYPGVDACFFVEPMPGADNQHGVAYEVRAQEISMKCLDYAVFDDKPLAYIYTHMDQAIAKGAFPYTEAPVVGKIPLMDEYTFFRNSYKPDDLVDRIWVEHCIASSFGAGLLLLHSPKLTCGFVVQSCSTSDENGKLIENYDHRRNIMDPLLWVLNKLRLFPLTTEV